MVQTLGWTNTRSIPSIEKPLIWVGNHSGYCSYSKTGAIPRGITKSQTVPIDLGKRQVMNLVSERNLCDTPLSPTELEYLLGFARDTCGPLTETENYLILVRRYNLYVRIVNSSKFSNYLQHDSIFEKSLST